MIIFKTDTQKENAKKAVYDFRNGKITREQAIEFVKPFVEQVNRMNKKFGKNIVFGVNEAINLL